MQVVIGGGWGLVRAWGTTPLLTGASAGPPEPGSTPARCRDSWLGLLGLSRVGPRSGAEPDGRKQQIQRREGAGQGLAGGFLAGLGLEGQERGNSHMGSTGTHLFDRHRMGPEEGLSCEQYQLQQRRIRGRRTSGWAWPPARVLRLNYLVTKNWLGVTWLGWS